MPNDTNIDRQVNMGSNPIYNENHYYQAGFQIPHALTRPPFLPEVFLGRTEELLAIKEKLFTGNHLLLLVNGEGGIGKTSLAATYYHTYQHEYSHVAWVLSEKNIANALLALAEPLGMRFDEKMSAVERLERLLQAMAELKKPCLLVIDNANELEDLEKNYQNLHCCSNFHILLTTRITEFGQAEHYAIEGLPETEALELFKKYYPEHQANEDELFQQIRAAVGGNTLVIELLAKNLHQINRHRTNYRLNDLLLDLQNKGLLALSQSRAVESAYHAGSGRRKEKAEDIIAAIYDLSQLQPDEIGLLSVFAVLPAESIRFEMLDVLLHSAENLDENLSVLAQKGWIEYNQTSRSFKCSPLVQEITKKKNPNLFEDCRTLIDTLIDKLEYEPGTGHFVNATYEEAVTFASYAESVVGSFSEANINLAILCERIGSYHRTTGNLDKALGFFEEVLKLTQELYAAFPNNVSLKNGLAISYSNLGATHTELGNLDKALEFFEERSRLGKELYEASPNNVSLKNGLAVSYSKLGETHTALGNLDKALGLFEEETELFQELYEAFPDNISLKNGLAISYEKLGDTHTALDNLDKALGFFEEALKLTQELYEAFPNNFYLKNGLAISYSKLGDTHTALGNLEKALGFFEEDLKLTQELYEAFPKNVSFKNGLAISYEKLGDTHTALGNLEKALGFFEEDLKLTQELYEAFPNNVSLKNGLAVSYERLGVAHIALGNSDKALGFFEEETELFQELYEAFPTNVSLKNGLAISYAKLGEFYRERKKDKKKARDYFRNAEKLWVELVRDAPGFVEFQRFLDKVRGILKGL